MHLNVNALDQAVYARRPKLRVHFRRVVVVVLRDVKLSDVVKIGLS
jgi:hypothetical protein